MQAAERIVRTFQTGAQASDEDLAELASARLLHETIGDQLQEDIDRGATSQLARGFRAAVLRLPQHRTVDEIDEIAGLLTMVGLAQFLTPRRDELVAESGAARDQFLAFAARRNASDAGRAAYDAAVRALLSPHDDAVANERFWTRAAETVASLTIAQEIGPVVDVEERAALDAGLMAGAAATAPAIVDRHLAEQREQAAIRLEHAQEEYDRRRRRLPAGFGQPIRGSVPPAVDAAADPAAAALPWGERGQIESIGDTAVSGGTVRTWWARR